MEKIMVLMFVVLILLYALAMSFFDDIIMRKTILRKYKSIEAEIVYFDTIEYFRGCSYVTIITCLINGKQKDFVLLKAKKDRIGDKILIRTNGNIAVREKLVLKEDISIALDAVIFLIILGLLKYIISYRLYFNWIVLLIEIGVILLLILLFPYMEEVYYQSINDRYKRSK